MSKVQKCSGINLHKQNKFSNNWSNFVTWIQTAADPGCTT